MAPILFPHASLFLTLPSTQHHTTTATLLLAEDMEEEVQQPRGRRKRSLSTAGGGRQPLGSGNKRGGSSRSSSSTSSGNGTEHRHPTSIGNGNGDDDDHDEDDDNNDLGRENASVARPLRQAASRRIQAEQAGGTEDQAGCSKREPKALGLAVVVEAIGALAGAPLIVLGTGNLVLSDEHTLAVEKNVEVVLEKSWDSQVYSRGMAVYGNQHWVMENFGDGRVGPEMPRFDVARRAGRPEYFIDGPYVH